MPAAKDGAHDVTPVTVNLSAFEFMFLFSQKQASARGEGRHIEHVAPIRVTAVTPNEMLMMMPRLHV